MMSNPEDSVLHRHIQSAFQFTDVAIPDIPQDSVLRRHVADAAQPASMAVAEPVNIKSSAAIKPRVSKAADQSPVEEKPSAVVTQVEQPASGLLAWFKRLLGG